MNVRKVTFRKTGNGQPIATVHYSGIFGISYTKDYFADPEYKLISAWINLSTGEQVHIRINRVIEFYAVEQGLTP
jgi:hypothetical protein